jgi:son of sevenless-like protein
LRELSLIQKESTDIIEVGGKGGSSGTKLINFEKRQWVNDILQHILKFQSQPYNLNKIPAIRKFIEDGLAEMDNIPDLLSLSTLTEPDDKEDEKMVRLLQESGFT